jgi:hypothetical protein
MSSFSVAVCHIVLIVGKQEMPHETKVIATHLHEESLVERCKVFFQDKLSF